MIWLAWRQQRMALLALGGYVLLLALLMTYYRYTMLAVVDAQDMEICVTTRYDPSCLPKLTAAMHGWYDTVDNARMAVAGYALLVGVFLGAPLFAREFEQHTHLLALTQSARPARWFTAKVAVVAVPAALGALLLGALYRWWTTALGDLLVPREGFHAGLFESQPPALFGYTTFAVGLGVLVGLAVRRVVPAMALTLVGWPAALYAVRRYVRQAYETPTVVERSYNDSRVGYLADQDRWRLDEGLADLDGNFVSRLDPAAVDADLLCRQAGGGAEFEACMVRQGFRSGADLVHPGDRFWWFQAVEATLFTAAGALCVIGAMWWLHKRFRREIRVPAAA